MKISLLRKDLLLGLATAYARPARSGLDIHTQTYMGQTLPLFSLLSEIRLTSRVLRFDSIRVNS